MMNNATDELVPTDSFFRRYFLGESIKNILIRLTVILSAIVLVWCGIMGALIIHTKCQRKKQILKTSNTHHHLHDSTLSLNKKGSKRNRRFNSTVFSTCCYSIRQSLSELKQRCGFSPSSTANENSVPQILSVAKPKRQSQTLLNCSATPNKIQLVVELMTKRSIMPHHNVGKRISLYREGQSSSGDQLKSLHSVPDHPKSQIEVNLNTSDTIQLIEPINSAHHPSISLPVRTTTDDHPTAKRLQKLREYNTKATLFFHPITRRLSSTNANCCLPPCNTIEKEQHHKPLLMVSSARELTTNEWEWHRALINETTPDDSRASSSRHIPLVMITDTSSSNTNILELDTFEDEHRFVGDLERRLARELRASYGPRHST